MLSNSRPSWKSEITVKVPDEFNMVADTAFIVLADEGRNDIFNAIRLGEREGIQELNLDQSLASSDHPHKSLMTMPASSIYFADNQDNLWALDQKLVEITQSREQLIIILNQRFDQLKKVHHLIDKLNKSALDQVTVLNLYEADNLEVNLSNTLVNKLIQVMTDASRNPNLNLEFIKIFLIDIFSEMGWEKNTVDHSPCEKPCPIDIFIDNISNWLMDKYSNKGILANDIEPQLTENEIRQKINELVTTDLLNQLKISIESYLSCTWVESSKLPMAISNLKLSKGQIEKNIRSHSDKTNKSNHTLIELIDPNFCYYLERPHTPDFTRNLEKMLVWLSDVDGTLREGFGMKDLAIDFLPYAINELHNQFEIKPEQREKNLLGIARLQEVVGNIQKFKDGQLDPSMNYEHLLHSMNKDYAASIEGLPVIDFCKMANRFSIDDYKLNGFNFAEPLMRILRLMGVATSLVTGMPAEMIGGYRKILGVQEICHPLQLRLKQDQGKLVFSNKVDHAGGTAVSKTNIVNAIKKNDHVIIGAAGDTGSDRPLFDGALGKYQGIRGNALFISDLGSANGTNTVIKIISDLNIAYRAGDFITTDPRQTDVSTIIHMVLTALREKISQAHDIVNDPNHVIKSIHPGYKDIANGAHLVENKRRLSHLLERTITDALNLYVES